MMQIRIVEVPSSFPVGWDLADEAPHGADLEALLDSARAIQGRLRRHVMSAAEFAKLAIPPRESVIDPFLPTSSLSMIYAARGVGKTWFALSMCLAICRGDDFVSFHVPKQRTVLFVDGEMAAADLQSRVRELDRDPPENLLLLPSEHLFRLDKPLNINSPDDQQAIEHVIHELREEGRGPEVVVFDNLSSLSGGIDENDNSALDALLQWLIGLRHKGLAVVLVHHAGKSGDQRGASRREDLLDTSIKLFKPKEDDDELPPVYEGANFTAEFVKTRGRMPNPSKIEMGLVTGLDGVLEWDVSTGVSASARDKTLKMIALQMPLSQDRIAKLRGLSKGAIIQHCASLRRSGFLERLEVTQRGREHLVELWPELNEQFMRQDDLPI